MFFAISSEFPEFSYKDKTLVFLLFVKHQQMLDCDVGCMRLLGDNVDQKKFGGECVRHLTVGLMADHTSRSQASASQRNVFQRFVFGLRNAGKSALLNALMEGPFSDKCTSTVE
ncbi:hypothetical protein AMTR_s00003p00023190 [Amborella trichopoda]|uniref:Uncharacterized protein n=1 Tax=Amborella trichopoda TaxID=13333 RepID=W1NZP9_AMBTC|nr:hypothetical protein AMTR_s00003p00023190 [Amborella trichopoda]